MRTLGLFSRAIFLVLVLSFVVSLPAHAEKWYTPTRQQLKMTKDPKAPNAAAVYLYRQETVNDREHFHSYYAVLKILTAGGKKWANVRLPYFVNEDGVSGYSISSISGRTIEPDGKVVKFKGRPYKKLMYQSDNEKVMAKVFTLPDVQVGSILEYRYSLNYGNNVIMAPQWYIQQPLFVHEAKYHFTPSKEYRNYESKDAQGHEKAVNQLVYVQVLPKGAKVQSGFDGFNLTVKNVPALVKEKDEVPINSVSERLLFYYSPFRDPKEYWSDEGEAWSKAVNRFASDSPVIQSAVKKIVSPGDTPLQKAEKLYAAVMKLGNTRYGRAYSKAEDRAKGIRVKTAADIWKAQRGTDDQIAVLYVALARAAGLKAYVMRISDRRNEIFEKNYMSWDQLDDDIAIVMINGKAVYLDPGQRFEDFGKLAWFHCLTYGVRQTAKGTEIAMTPGQSYRWNMIHRYATLQLSPQGKISGNVRVVYTGAFSLKLRHEVLEDGIAKAKRKEQQRWQSRMPPGVQIKVNHFVGLKSTNTVLMEMLDVSGTLGTRAGKVRIIPGNILEAGVKPLFSSSTRKIPVDLGPTYLAEDQVSITLPPNYKLQGVPTNGAFKFMPNAVYQSVYKVKGNTYHYVRLEVVARAEYAVKSYPGLKNFFQTVSHLDQQPLVFKVGPAPAKASAKAAGAAASTAVAEVKTAVGER